MNTKLKQELLDLAHLLHQAIITDDDRVSEAALADLRAALDRTASASDAAGGAAREGTRSTEGEGMRYRSKFNLLRADKMATMVMRGNLGGQPKPLVAHIQKFDTYCTSEIFRDGDVCPIVDLVVYGGFNRTRRVTQGAMRGMMSSIGKHFRMHSNKRARENSATQVNG